MYDLALNVIKLKQPDLLFLDWSIRGGNAFSLLEEINAIQDYKPYIIFFTGYQSDNPEIPQEIINKHRVNRYLIKPIWEKLTRHLPEYITEAESLIQDYRKMFFWIETILKEKIRIVPENIICISQSRSNPRNKIIHYQTKTFEIKASWEACEKIARQFEIDYCFANARETLVNKEYITKIQRPYVWLNDKLKVEVTKEKWREIEI